MKQFFQLLVRNNLTANQFYLLYHFRQNITPKLINVEAELMVCRYGGWITPDNNLSDKAIMVLNDAEAMFKKVKVKVSADVLGENYMDNVKTYRELFPVKTSSGSRSLRTSPEDLKDRFVWFFQKYPNFDWALVLAATQHYVDQNKHTEYISSAANYIKKQENQGSTIISKLANDCQAVLDGMDVAPQTSFYSVD